MSGILRKHRIKQPLNFSFYDQSKRGVIGDIKIEIPPTAIESTTIFNNETFAVISDETTSFAGGVYSDVITLPSVSSKSLLKTFDYAACWYSGNTITGPFVIKWRIDRQGTTILNVTRYLTGVGHEVGGTLEPPNMVLLPGDSVYVRYSVACNNPEMKIATHIHSTILT